MSSKDKLAKLTHPRNWGQFPLADRSRVDSGNQRPASGFLQNPQQFMLGQLSSLFKYKAREAPDQP